MGPSHKKIFTTQCVVGDLESTGEGRSKKESKKAAAENILPQLMNIPESKTPNKNVESTSKKSKKKKNKKNKVIKTTFDKIDRMFDSIVDFGKDVVNSIGGTKVDIFLFLLIFRS